MPRAVLSLDALRARIREIEGVQIEVRRTPSGVAVLDDLIGGLPRPGMVEVHGAVGSGRTRLALAVAASRTRRGQRVAWVDFGATLYPPAVEQHGVNLRAFLVLRPPADRATWAAEQVMRSGCFSLVVLGDAKVARWSGQRWSRAAEQGGCTVLSLSERASRLLPASVRLRTSGQEVAVLRDRGGGQVGRVHALPPWPDSGDPWH